MIPSVFKSQTARGTYHSQDNLEEYAESEILN